MAGKNQITAFKESFGATSTFVGGRLPPDKILIVGVDLPIEDWNADLWDEARLAYAKAHPIDPRSLIKTVDAGGSIPPVSVVRRRDMTLCVEGRRRILGSREANKILLKEGNQPDALIELAVFVDKGTDLEVSVRVGNAGRLDDPPYVSAANAARLLGRGKDEEQIASILNVETSTIKNWLAYAANLCPTIKAQIEDASIPKADRIPFAIGVELAKYSGPGEHQAQRQALDYLKAQGAKLTGEKGRENAKLAIRAAMAGTLESNPEELDLEDPPASAPYLLETGRQTQADPPSQQIPTTGNAAPDSKPPQSASTGEKRGSGPRVATQVQKLSWPAIREIAAHLEPSQNDPHNTEADKVAHAIFQILTGADPTADGLEAWPRVQAKFRKVVRSPTAPAPQQAATSAAPAGDKTKTRENFRMVDRPCVTCKGTKINPHTKKPCSPCEGKGVLKVKESIK